MTVHRPTTVSEVLELLGIHGDEAVLLAGGTALMLPPRRAQLGGRTIITLRDVPELHGVRLEADGALRIGAMTAHATMASNPLVASFCPALRAMFSRIAYRRVRAHATLGGNLALGDPAHDPPAVLIALGARARIARGEERREVAIEDLADGPFSVGLAGDELVVDVLIPPCAGQRAAHRRFIAGVGAFRDGAAYPTVSCGVALKLDGTERCRGVRIGLTGVHPHPVRALSTERLLEGDSASPDAIRAAALAVRDELEPIDDARGSAGYKLEMAAVWIERTLTDALASAPMDQPEAAHA